jgi:trimethylamine--corrinoid protein Co-methyltransferase
VIDFQVGYEKSIGAMLSAMSGANMINHSGGIMGELSYHPALSVLDNDVVGYIGRFLEGVTVNEDTLAIDLINETGPIPGFFLNTDHTREWWHKEQFMPHAADMLTYPEWVKTGKKTALDYARERADELLASWESKLPPGKEEEVDKILEECREWYKKQGLI